MPYFHEGRLPTESNYYRGTSSRKGYYQHGRLSQKRGRGEASSKDDPRDHTSRTADSHYDDDQPERKRQSPRRSGIHARDRISSRRPPTRRPSEYQPSVQRPFALEHARGEDGRSKRDAPVPPRPSPEVLDSKSIRDSQDQLNEDRSRGRSPGHNGAANSKCIRKDRTPAKHVQKTMHPPSPDEHPIVDHASAQPNELNDHSSTQPTAPMPPLLSEHYFESPEHQSDPEWALLTGILDESIVNWALYGSVNHKDSAGKNWQQKKAEGYRGVSKAEVAQRYCQIMRSAREDFGKKLNDKVAEVHKSLQKRSDQLHEENHRANPYSILVKPKLPVPEHGLDSLKHRRTLVAAVLQHSKSFTRFATSKKQAVETCKDVMESYMRYLPAVFDQIYRETRDAIIQAMADELTKRCIPFYKSQNRLLVFEWGYPRSQPPFEDADSETDDSEIGSPSYSPISYTENEEAACTTSSPCRFTHTASESEVEANASPPYSPFSPDMTGFSSQILDVPGTSGSRSIASKAQSTKTATKTPVCSQASGHQETSAAIAAASLDQQQSPAATKTANMGVSTHLGASLKLKGPQTLQEESLAGNKQSNVQKAALDDASSETLQSSAGQSGSATRSESPHSSVVEQIKKRKLNPTKNSAFEQRFRF